jgi:hypothetical protein
MYVYIAKFGETSKKLLGEGGNEVVDRGSVLEHRRCSTVKSIKAKGILTFYTDIWLENLHLSWLNLPVAPSFMDPHTLITPSVASPRHTGTSAVRVMGKGRLRNRCPARNRSLDTISRNLMSSKQM